ncbi:redoxin family protein [Massilia sp. CCM 8734]|uniref:redoxin family protein n=1 Tax=Massilia sp. CCM 8734 TaxID=2609283 RepID=UPI001E32329C|nr:redoxin family protein [Massilia sp. CCM 8734]
MNRYSIAALGCVAVLGVAALSMPSGSRAATPYRSSLPVQAAMPGFDGATTWFNSAPLTPAQLRGKVVLVDFWTYSCINCIRTVPYVRAWADKYRAHGLTVVGVHSPEFRFEKDLTNVSAAVSRFKIDFPVAVDSDHRIWQAWGNNAWPAWYLVDANGKIRYRQVGEGGYDKLERAMQSLLAEARGAPVDATLVDPAGAAEQMAPNLRHLDSAETYVGYRQASGFNSPEGVRRDVAHQYSVGQLGLNQWALSGRWTVNPESARAELAGGAIAHRFRARDLHLVMGTGQAGRSVRIKVSVDGRAPGADHGADIDADGNGVVTATRLYQLVRQSGSALQRRVEIRFLDSGADVYAFTFG